MGTKKEQILSNEYFIAIGGNIGDVEKRFFDTLTLVEKKIGKISNLSKIYLSKPLPTRDCITQDRYLNAVFMVSTEFAPKDVLNSLIKIEEEMGRDRNLSVGWGPRTIDLDIISISNQIIEEDNLKIPHPRMYERDFVLLPLKDISPEWSCPRTEKKITQIIKDLSQEFLFIENTIEEKQDFSIFRSLVF
jgi:2-amino-4-hydroxy-6-hydroxymethyldihydropteridine diphosphokinase